MSAEVEPTTGDLLTRNSYPHWRTDVIRFADLDPIGHVNNVAYIAFFESGRVMFFRDLGCAVDQPDFAWMTVRLEINYFQQLSLPGTIDVGTGVLEIGRSSVRLSHAVFAQDKCVAQGECVMVMVDRSQDQASAIPEDLRDRLAALSCG